MVPIFTIGHKRLHRGKIGKKVGGKEVLCNHIYIYKIDIDKMGKKVGGIKITKKKNNYGAKSEITNDGKKNIEEG